MINKISFKSGIVECPGQKKQFINAGRCIEEINKASEVVKKETNSYTRLVNYRDNTLSFVPDFDSPPQRSSYTFGINKSDIFGAKINYLNIYSFSGNDKETFVETKTTQEQSAAKGLLGALNENAKFSVDVTGQDIQELLNSLDIKAKI